VFSRVLFLCPNCVCHALNRAPENAFDSMVPSVIVILIQSASSSSLSSVNIILIINILIIIVVIISSIHSIFGATTTIFYNAVFMMTKVDGGSKFGEMTAVDNEV